MKHSRDVVGLQRFKYGTGAFMNKHSGIYLLVQFRRRCRPRKPVSCLALLFIHAGCAAATANTLLLSGCRRWFVRGARFRFDFCCIIIFSCRFRPVRWDWHQRGTRAPACPSSATTETPFRSHHRRTWESPPTSWMAKPRVPWVSTGVVPPNRNPSAPPTGDASVRCSPQVPIEETTAAFLNRRRRSSGGGQ